MHVKHNLFPCCYISISVAMQYSSLSHSDSSPSLLIHTHKLRNTHTTAVKCCTNTFYRPPLTSLIRTLHLKVGGGKKRKQICLQGLTLAGTMEASLAAVGRHILFSCGFFEELFPLFLQVSKRKPMRDYILSNNQQGWLQKEVSFYRSL